MKTTTVWALSLLLLGLAACTEQGRENMREDTDRVGEDVEQGFDDTGDRVLQEREDEREY